MTEEIIVREIRSEIEIEASSETVWSVLTDFAAFPEWNPFMRSVAGELAQGGQITVTMQPPGHGASTFRPTLLSVDAGRGFRWRGHVLVPGIFDGEHVHEIEALAPGRTRYIQREEFRGVLVPFVGGMLRDTERGFQEMNAALKARAERAAAELLVDRPAALTAPERAPLHAPSRGRVA
jgi:hypothetical protein